MLLEGLLDHHSCQNHHAIFGISCKHGLEIFKTNLAPDNLEDI